MVTATDDIWARLTGLVSKIDSVGLRRVGQKVELTPETDLVLDLGLVGDDAFQFMETYASCFNLQKGDYDASRYFEPEGLWLLPTFKKRKSALPITLGMLAMAAKIGEWKSELLDRASSTRQYE
jgi:Protein of unknown function (DUF1493)